MHRQTGIRGAAWAVGLCLLTTGCIPLAYVYPTAEFVPATPTNAPRDEVKAIRVDAVQSHNGSYLDYKERILLKEVALGKQGQVPAQLTAGIDRGWLWNCVVLSYSGHTHRTVEVRVHRRSYQTAVLKSGEKTGTVAWQPADDLAARVQALDDLLSPVVQPVWHNKNQVSDDLDFLWGLAPGSAGKEHKKVLLWAAEEYEALAQDDKAKRVRALADQ